jgi:multiple sugar transport system substrate-binding protein
MFKKALSTLAILALSMGFAQKTLEIWIMPNSPKPIDDLKAIVAPFEKANNVEVKVTVLDWGVAWTRITTAATSGVGPDIVQLGTTWVGAITAMNLDLRGAEDPR